MRAWCICLLLLLSVRQASGFEGWTHLECGAGNYGADGHTQASQVMTVLQKFKYVSDAQNYIDLLDPVGHGAYLPEEQYGVLFWTLDQLVSRYGAHGLFHVNDLYEEYAVFAADKLRAYAADKGYSGVVIEVLPGDYQQIDPRETLAPYGKAKYSSVHLKNPELAFYHDTLDGDFLFSSEHSRNETRQLLQQLANLSEEGLYLFILDHENFIPPEEKAQFIEPGIFYYHTAEWAPVPYIFPEGEIYDTGIVFAILAE